MIDNILLTACIAVSMISEIIILIALRKYITSRKVASNIRIYYNLTFALFVVLISTHVVSIVTIPFLNAESQTEDSLACTIHGALYIYLQLWYYILLMFLAIESFLCLYITPMTSFSKFLSDKNRWRNYLNIGFICTLLEFVFVGKTVKFGRNTIACTFKGTNGPESPVSKQFVWYFHWYPAMCTFVSFLAVIAVFFWLKSKYNKIRRTAVISMDVVIRMAMLPSLGYFHWSLVILTKYQIIKIPIREISGLRGLLISLYLYFMNNHLKSISSQIFFCSICKIWRNRKEDGGGGDDENYDDEQGLISRSIIIDDEDEEADINYIELRHDLSDVDY